MANAKKPGRKRLAQKRPNSSGPGTFVRDHSSLLPADELNGAFLNEDETRIHLEFTDGDEFARCAGLTGDEALALAQDLISLTRRLKKPISLDATDVARLRKLLDQTEK